MREIINVIHVIPHWRILIYHLLVKQGQEGQRGNKEECRLDLMDLISFDI